MKVFVTGASGFIGSAIVRELLVAGHQVVGLARSDEGAASIAAAGAQVQRGTLDDLDVLRKATDDADGVLHTAYMHDFANLGQAAYKDQQAIETLGEALAGSQCPLVVASGLAVIAQGRLATEEDAASLAVGRVSEPVALALTSRGVRVSVVRMPTVHGEGDHGFLPNLINIAREKGISAYPGDGSNRWAAVHRLDAARLFRLALEKAPAGSRLHAADDEGIPTRDIAGVISGRLNIPLVALPAEQVGEHFGWIGSFFAMEIAASSQLTQARLGWHPTQPGLLADLDQDYYFPPK